MAPAAGASGGAGSARPQLSLRSASGYGPSGN